MLPRKTFFLALVLALAGLYAAPLQAQSVSPGPFFDDEEFLGFDVNNYPVYYLEYFNEFTYLPGNSNYIYKYDFGWLCYLGSTEPTTTDVYVYDCTSGDYFWTDPAAYPSFYSFKLGTFLYYYEGSSPRVFFDFYENRVISY